MRQTPRRILDQEKAGCDDLLAYISQMKERNGTAEVKQSKADWQKIIKELA